MDSVMDYLGGAATVSISKPAASGSILEGIIGIVVAVAVLRLEVTRRAADLPQRGSGIHGCVRSARSILRQHIPEVLGLVTCLGLAGVLRVQGAIDSGVDEKTYAEIMRQWPLLHTADSLLALQAMLRLVVFLSAVLRGGIALPLSQEAAVFFGSAALARVALAARSSAYRLDGPLGGFLPAICELVSVPLLGTLCHGIRGKTVVTSALTIFAAAWVAHRNRLSLAEDALTDGLFIFAHITELLAAFAYLFRALLLGGSRRGVAVHFGHIVLPLQQGLAAYYFVQAFDIVPELVGSGHPFELLQVGGIAQLGVYAAAAVIHLAEHLESPLNSPTEEEDEEQEDAEEETFTVPSRVQTYRPAVQDGEVSKLTSEHGVPRAMAVRPVF